MVKENWSKKGCLDQSIKKKSLYYSSPKKKSVPAKLCLIQNKTFYDCLQNDHNYFKNSKTLKAFYNIEKLYAETMNKSDSTKINSFNNNIITGKGIKTLQGSTWLDDEVINSYFQLVADSSNLKIFFVDSINYANFKKYHLLNQPYSLRHSKVSFEGLDLVFVAINFSKIDDDSGHWGFAVVHTKDRVIKFYDSIKNFAINYNGHCVCDEVRKFLRSTNFISNIPACEWQIEYPETPQQQDADSCGVFACQLAKQISRSQQLDLDTKDIPYLRKEMTCEIALGVLFK